jgi:hypothetical protein
MIRNLRSLGLFVTLLLAVGQSRGYAGDQPSASLAIAVAGDAPAEVRQAAQSLVAACSTHVLLKVFCAGQPISAPIDSRTLAAASPPSRAFRHLVLVGLPEDPLISAAWQHEARRTDSGWYVFGFGHLSGTIGYVESDRNPFLHSSDVERAPRETEIVTITGNTASGVALAAQAFLNEGLINGVVAGPGWTRGPTTLLDRDPLPVDFPLPELLPASVGDMTRIGVTQPGENEYREVLAQTGAKPRVIWRAKYFRPGAWDLAGAVQAMPAYAVGLHRRAYGNTLWAAEFASPENADDAARKIAAAAKLSLSAGVWTGQQPPYGPEKESAGPLALWQLGSWLVMSTLPSEVNDALLQP